MLAESSIWESLKGPLCNEPASTICERVRVATNFWCNVSTGGRLAYSWNSVCVSSWSSSTPPSSCSFPFPFTQFRRWDTAAVFEKASAVQPLNSGIMFLTSLFYWWRLKYSVKTSTKVFWHHGNREASFSYAESGEKVDKLFLVK